MHLVLLIVISSLFAIQAIRAKRLIVSALWLASASASLSVVFYLLGAYQVAVIELSVGAGLVTVLFVFAISIAGEDIGYVSSLIPRWLALGLATLPILLLGWLTLPPGAIHPPVSEPDLATMLWQQRGLDVLVQVGLIFAGVLGLLGLLAESKAPLKYPVAEEVAARRERELETLYQQSLEKEVI